MNAPHHPLVVVVAHAPTDDARAADVSHSAAVSWRHRVAERQILGGRDVVFTWMDAEKWTSWMKSMYGIKADSLPAVVVTDHQVCVFTTNA